MIRKIRELLCEIAETVEKNEPSSRLPQNTYFLRGGAILALPREGGESRYPYDADGYVVWA